MTLWRYIYFLSLWIGFLFHSTSSSHVLPSLADVDFQRIRSDQLHSSSTGGVVFPSASLKRDLVGSGYHRELVTSVELGGTALNSRVLLVENITRDIYMDIDQVLSRREFGGPEILTSEHMDTERPASLSSGHIVLVYTYLTNTFAEVRIPIHFRYQPPSSDSAYTSVLIPAPTLLVPHPLGSASLPCHADTRDTCPWAIITPVAGDNPRSVGELKALIPRGMEGWSSFLVIITCLVTLAAMLVILYTITSVAVTFPLLLNN